MALFKSGNPALDKETFQEFAASEEATNSMTLQGTVNKTGILLLLVFVSALYPWQEISETHNYESLITAFWISLVGAAAIGFWIAHNKEHAGILAPIYAILEGFVLGELSALMNVRYPGIVFESLMLTFGIATSLLIIYKFEWIQPNENFKLIVSSATAGIVTYYIISLLLGFFGINAPLLNDSSVMGIIFSLFVVVIAAMNLVVDFDFIEDGVSRKCPKYMEWYGAFGIMVTIIWLYIEILRLLAKSRRR